MRERESERERERFCVFLFLCFYYGSGYGLLAAPGSICCFSKKYFEAVYLSFQPVLHDWCNKGRGMYYPACRMMHIKETLLLIVKSK